MADKYAHKSAIFIWHKTNSLHFYFKISVDIVDIQNIISKKARANSHLATGSDVQTHVFKLNVADFQFG